MQAIHSDVTTKWYGRRESNKRESERKSKAIARFLEEHRQKHYEGDNPKCELRRRFKQVRNEEKTQTP